MWFNGSDILTFFLILETRLLVVEPQVLALLARVLVLVHKPQVVDDNAKLKTGKVNLLLQCEPKKSPRRGPDIFHFFSQTVEKL